MSQLTTNTTSLQAILDAVNKLPEAGGEDVTAETEAYTNLLTDLEAAVDALPDAGSGAVELVTGVFTATSEMGDEPGVYNVTLTSDTLAASSRMFIAILLDDSLSTTIINFLYRFSQTDDWKNAMGGSYALAGITVNDTTISGKGDFALRYAYNYIAG